MYIYLCQFDMMYFVTFFYLWIYFEIWCLIALLYSFNTNYFMQVLQKDCKKTKYLNENLNVGMKFLQSNGNVANVPFEVGKINRKGRLPTTSNNYTSNRQSYLPSHSINDIETAITDLAGKQLSRDDQNQVDLF